MRTRRIIAAVALCATPLALAACGGSDSAVPNLKGTWTGTYEFPTPEKTVATSPLTIEITKQEGSLLWGTETWTDNGATLTAELRGSLSTDNSSVILAETGGFFSGNIGDNSMRLRFVRTEEPATAFVVTVTRGS
jgi:hypothetical protein